MIPSKKPVRYIIRRNIEASPKTEELKRRNSNANSKDNFAGPTNPFNITIIGKLIIESPLQRVKSAIVKNVPFESTNGLSPLDSEIGNLKRRSTFNMTADEARNSGFLSNTMDSAKNRLSSGKSFLIRKKKSSFSDSYRITANSTGSRATTRESEGAQSLANDKKEDDYIDKLFEETDKMTDQDVEEILSQEEEFHAIMEESDEKVFPSEQTYSINIDSVNNLENAENNLNPKKNNEEDLEVKLGDVIGEGAYGQVYKGLSLERGEFIAAKHIKTSALSKETRTGLVSLCQEISVYQKLDHPNIVRYMGSKQTTQETYIYMEYMPGGSISSMLKQYGRFEEKLIQKFTKQMVQGLDYLHSKGVIHRDIKGGNIMSDASGNVKLADFGAAKHIENYSISNSVSSDLCDSIKGSLFWMAPELLNQEKHGRKIDIWSLGCTIIEMATANHPWPNVKSLPELIITIMTQKCPPIPAHLSQCAKDFIKECCQFDKNLRPRAKDLLKHPFLN